MTETKSLNKMIIHPDIEPGVIDNAMLTRCILEHGPKEEAGRLFAEEGVHLDETQTVRLEFQNILRIDHLWMLKSLRKLTLAHNLIEKIENLEQLTGLNELDLSFNKIEKIENLDALVNLEVLTLFHNKIRKLENMEKLNKLLVFSIGDNLIEDYKEGFRKNLEKNQSTSLWSLVERFDSARRAYTCESTVPLIKAASELDAIVVNKRLSALSSKT
ncbi:unnamed protein product [Parnassius apollo]|uniref:Dynein axonemal assembly factor 1 homolog n=1 Tax=Parnassius apollo TaxID=110799 RepID=A0A8S3W8J0_PARAO|nr:unnamed protein product [Parnassius apollo]